MPYIVYYLHTQDDLSIFTTIFTSWTFHESLSSFIKRVSWNFSLRMRPQQNLFVLSWPLLSIFWILFDCEKLMHCTVCVKRITLCNFLCSSSSCFSGSVIRNIGEKSYFTDHQTANTIGVLEIQFRSLKYTTVIRKQHNMYYH